MGLFGYKLTKYNWDMDANTFINNAIRDIKTELDAEFDENFERKAFFDRRWAPLSRNYHPTGGSMLVRTGALRQNLRSRIDGTRLIYSNSLPYAGLMNDGGTVRQDFVPTPKMRRWAWARHRELLKAGQTAEAEKFRRMALAKRIRRTFTVPARPFVGEHPRVWEIASDVMAEHVARAVEAEVKKFPRYRGK